MHKPDIFKPNRQWAENTVAAIVSMSGYPPEEVERFEEWGEGEGMTTVRFGDRIEFVANPGVVLLLEGMLSEWVMELVEKGDVNLEREAMGMAQQIIGALAKEGDRHD
ncbi:hypothetical protein ACQ4M4_12705 [Leptolyngbya sp. AN02str]|uniref:hypothetical protein n=1 Tax=Leptolyngbya sp. AN02str TaxID=3423363 RepID=UPI003D322A67